MGGGAAVMERAEGIAFQAGTEGGWAGPQPGWGVCHLHLVEPAACSVAAARLRAPRAECLEAAGSGMEAVALGMAAARWSPGCRVGGGAAGLEALAAGVAGAVAAGR
jgi:hypothetical protein